MSPVVAPHDLQSHCLLDPRRDADSAPRVPYAARGSAGVSLATVIIYCRFGFKYLDPYLQAFAVSVALTCPLAYLRSLALTRIALHPATSPPDLQSCFIQHQGDSAPTSTGQLTGGGRLGGRTPRRLDNLRDRTQLSLRTPRCAAVGQQHKQLRSPSSSSRPPLVAFALSFLPPVRVSAPRPHVSPFTIA